MIKVCLFALILNFIISEPAYAYLDPGLVSLAIQGLVAALAGAALTWKLWWWRLMMLLGVGRKRKSETEARDAPVDPSDRSDSE